MVSAGLFVAVVISGLFDVNDANVHFPGGAGTRPAALIVTKCRCLEGRRFPGLCAPPFALGRAAAALHGCWLVLFAQVYYPAFIFGFLVYRKCLRFIKGFAIPLLGRLGCRTTE